MELPSSKLTSSRLMLLSYAQITPITSLENVTFPESLSKKGILLSANKS